EFSFILAELGVALNLLPKEGRDLILAGAIISILLNPLIFATVDWLTRRLNQEARHTEPALASEDFAPKSTALANHTILVGCGRGAGGGEAGWRGPAGNAADVTLLPMQQRVRSQSCGTSALRR